MASLTPPGKIIHHANGHVTHVMIDDFTDPWQPAETILIQPGFGRHSPFFYHWVPALARKYHVVRRDLYGHGYSGYNHANTDNDELTMDIVCGDIVDTLDQLGIDRVHFLGESTSGMVGHALAATHPERLLSLTTCSTPTHLPPAALDLFAFGHKDWPTACRTLGSRGWAEKLSNVGGTVSAENDDGYLTWWLDTVGISSGEGMAQYAQFLSTADARPYLPNVKVPLLILAPAKSAATSLEEQRDIQGQVKGSTLEVINGKGHEIYQDQAEACLGALLKFLSSLG